MNCHPQELMAMDTSPTVQLSGNHIYFYGEVTTNAALQLVLALSQAQQEAMVMANNRTAETPIWLHINSGGGNVFDAVAVVDHLEHLRVPVYSVIEGHCASAATLISIACTKRFILPSALMMIHQLQTELWGTLQQAEDQMGVSRRLHEWYLGLYMRFSNRTAGQLSEMLKHDTWFNADEALKYGFVDEVMRPRERAARTGRRGLRLFRWSGTER